jgi:hypothetical protein
MKSVRTGRLRKGIASVTLAAFVAGLAPAVAAQQNSRGNVPLSRLNIDHDPLACVNTDLAPKVDAVVVPAPIFERGYVYFKADGTEDFYYTPMKGTPENLAGVLPRPLPATRAIDYYVRATDTDSLAKRTKDFVPPVVVGNACKAKGVVVGKEGAGLTIGLTRADQNPVPPGFNRRDIAFVILASGAVVGIAAALKGAGAAGTGTSGSSGTGATGASGGAAGGAGISTAVIVAGGVVVAGAAAAVAVNANKSSNTATPTPTVTPTPTPTKTFTPTIPPLRFAQAEVSWSGVGDLDLQILNASNQSVGQTFPAGCESTSNRTERVLLQGSALVSGTYRVVLTGKTCGGATPSSISAFTIVQSESGPLCSGSFVSVPVPGTLNGCSFTLP